MWRTSPVSLLPLLFTGRAHLFNSYNHIRDCIFSSVEFWSKVVLKESGSAGGYNGKVNLERGTDFGVWSSRFHTHICSNRLYSREKPRNLPEPPTIKKEAQNSTAGSPDHDVPNAGLVYEPLDPSRNEIRLLRIIGGTDDGPIKCQLETVSMDAPDIHFAALSYVWGDPGITEEVYVNSHPRQVTTNLGSALRHFWKFAMDNNEKIRIHSIIALSEAFEHSDEEVEKEVHERDREQAEREKSEARTTRNHSIVVNVKRISLGFGRFPIWIDALCINQDDSCEKNHQISLMRKIFKNAQIMFSWLGLPDDRNIDLALKTMRTIPPYTSNRTDCLWMEDHPELCIFDKSSGDGYPFMNKHWNAVNNFGQSEYFHRIWICQELYMAKVKTVFLCGTECLSLPELLNYTSWGLMIPHMQPHPTMHPTLWGSLEALLPRFDRLLIDILSENFDKRATYTLENFASFLGYVAGCGCTDPRDYVYGLLGIFPMGIIPDYDLSVKEVYMDWATNPHWEVPPTELLYLSGIGHYPTTREDWNFPSWLPDLSGLRKLGKSMATGLSRCISRGVPEHFRATVSKTNGVTCFGVQVTAVAEVVTRALRTPSGQKLDSKKYDQLPFSEQISHDLLPILEYLLANLSRLRNDTYCTGESRLLALVQTLIYRRKDLPHISAQSIFKTLLSWMKQTMVGSEILNERTLQSMGCTTETELWNSLDDLQINLGDTHPAVDIEEDRKGLGQLGSEMHDINDITKFAAQHKLFHTTDGLIGRGPLGLMENDQVYLIHGLSWPILLRQVDGKFVNVGVCYVHGISDADALKILSDRESDVQELNII